MAAVPAVRGTTARIRRGAPAASADRIATPSPVASCSVVGAETTPGPAGFDMSPEPELPGPGPGFWVGDEHAAHATANNRDGTAARIWNIKASLASWLAYKLRLRRWTPRRGRPTTWCPGLTAAGDLRIAQFALSAPPALPVSRTNVPGRSVLCAPGSPAG